MRKVLAFVSVASAAAGFPVMAVAQDTVIEDGPYLRLGVGATAVSNWTQDFTYNPGAVFVTPPPAGQSVDQGESLAFAAAIGFDYADGIRTELEYRYASTPIGSITPAGGAAIAPAKDDLVAQFVMTNFYFDFANSTALTPYIGGGVGGAFISNENSQHDAALALQGRAGVSIAFGAGLSADLEYIYLRTNELAFGPGVDDLTPGGPVGPAITGERYQSSSAMLSLRKQF